VKLFLKYVSDNEGNKKYLFGPYDLNLLHRSLHFLDFHFRLSIATLRPPRVYNVYGCRPIKSELFSLDKRDRVHIDISVLIVHFRDASFDYKCFMCDNYFLFNNNAKFYILPMFK